MSSFSSSVSGSNKSLAWSMGNGGGGFHVLRFPLELDWYYAQPRKKFRTLRHHKERSGIFRHEFIVLQFEDGSVCRVERRGDPRARMDALSTHGCAAVDVIQRFESHIDANLDTSDVIAEITFPFKLDILDVLHVCRAIHEGDKTCNYSLLTTNCYFFALAIQSTLAREVPFWGGAFRKRWNLRLHEALSSLSELHRASPSLQPFIIRLYQLFPSDVLRPTEPLLVELKESAYHPTILSSIEERIESNLWRADVEAAVKKLCHQVARDMLVKTLPKPCEAPEPDPTAADGIYLLKELILKAASKHKDLESQDSSFSDRVQYYIRSYRKFAFCSSKKEPTYQNRPSNLDYQPHTSSGYIPPVAPLQNSSVAYTYSLVQVPYWLQTLTKTVFWLIWITRGFTLRLLSMLATAFLNLSTRCTMIEDYLLPVVLRAEGSGSCLDLLTQELVLIARSNTAAWLEWPWAYVYTAISSLVLDIIFGDEEDCLELKLQENLAAQSVTVSSFQRHLRHRIKLHAERIDVLGPRVCDEIHHRLSQVWVLVRNDPPRSLSTHWVVYQPHPQLTPFDDINKWMRRAKAEVDWHFESERAPDNTAIHTAVPIVSCFQYHRLSNSTLSHLRRVYHTGEPPQRVVEQSLSAFLNSRGEVLFDFTFEDYQDQGGFTVAWPTEYVSRMEYLPVQSCVGRGPSKRGARQDAAQRLLRSGICMIRL